MFAVRPRSRGQKVRSRPYADPYSTLTDELPSDLGLWSDDDEEARRLIYSNSLSDIVSSSTLFLNLIDRCRGRLKM